MSEVIVGITMMRNEADIAEVVIRHHLSMCDEVLAIDNGSTDGLDRVFQRLVKGGSALRWRRDPGVYEQAEMITGLAQEAHTRGADWVIPFDGDEFWVSRAGDLRSVIEGSPAAMFEVPVFNFVQRRETPPYSPSPLMTMTKRVVDPYVDDALGRREAVQSGLIPFVAMDYPSKLVTRTSQEIAVLAGNHAVRNVEGPIARDHPIECLHAPLRSRTALERKAETGEHLERSGYPPSRGWHLRRWAQLRRDGLLDEEWRRNTWTEDSTGGGPSWMRWEHDERLPEIVRRYEHVSPAGSRPSRVVSAT